MIFHKIKVLITIILQRLKIVQSINVQHHILNSILITIMVTTVQFTESDVIHFGIPLSVQSFYLVLMTGLLRFGTLKFLMFVN